MPPKSSRKLASAKSSSSDGPSRRYAPVTQKDESVWKREWAGFMCGVNMKTLRDGSNKVSVQSSKDLSNEVGDSEHNGPTFSYLFESPAEKKAARREKEKKNAKKEAERISKHQQAILEAQSKGLQFPGMNRKEKRKFLHLSMSAEEAELEKKAATDLKPHELMDEKIAWYQQGPYPIDVISEKLVRRKAEKKGRQLQLRYNYLLPHPSWIAKRSQRRKEASVAALGKRIIFDDEGRAIDPITNTIVDLREPSSAWVSRRTLDSLLVDLAHGSAAYSGNRVVVKNKEAASIIEKSNLTTNFLSPSLVAGKLR